MVTADAERVVSAAGSDRARFLAQFQTLGLAVQFLLGMVLYMVGVPSRASGGAHTASIGILSAHVVVTAGLVAGAALIIRATAGTQRWRRWLARGGAAAIGAAAVAGIITLITRSGWWSYGMAVGFTAALAAYGGLLIPASDDGPPALNGSRPAR